MFTWYILTETISSNIQSHSWEIKRYLGTLWTEIKGRFGIHSNTETTLTFSFIVKSPSGGNVRSFSALVRNIGYNETVPYVLVQSCWRRKSRAPLTAYSSTMSL